MPTTALHELQQAVLAVVDFDRGDPTESDARLSVAAALSHRMMTALARCHRDGLDPADLRDVVSAAREVHRRSPFVARLQTWPRGYPGDFETVEYILDQQNRATPGSAAFCLEQVALDSPIAQQHRNKVALQAQAILEAVAEAEEADREARILVLACGGAADLGSVQRALIKRDVRIVLMDQDPDALAFALRRLHAIRTRVTAVARNVLRGMAHVRDHGPFDLVLAGGLFDYLPDTAAVFLLRQVRQRLLAPGGRMFFTNISSHNPYRLWIETMGSWSLIHRTDADLVSMAIAAGFDAGAIGISRDRTGLALVADCRIAAAGEAASSASGAGITAADAVA